MESAVVKRSVSLHDGQFYNGNKPRAHRWVTHQKVSCVKHQNQSPERKYSAMMGRMKVDTHRRRCPHTTYLGTSDGDHPFWWPHWMAPTAYSFPHKTVHAMKELSANSMQRIIAPFLVFFLQPPILSLWPGDQYGVLAIWIFGLWSIHKWGPLNSE